MTYEEATEIGEEIIVFYDLIDAEEEAMEILLEATEKQIPKVAKKVDVQPYFRKHYSNDLTCPVCHNRVSVKMNYCPNCGQRLE